MCVDQTLLRGVTVNLGTTLSMGSLSMGLLSEPAVVIERGGELEMRRQRLHWPERSS